MKRIISLATLFCILAGSALAAAPENALKALTLGNEMHALQKSLGKGPVAQIVADPAMTVPASLFGLDEAQLQVIKAAAPFGPGAGLAVQAKDIAAPLILVLGLEENAMWTVYAETLQASPDLVHAVLKGEVMAQGAILDQDSGTVTILGAHPEQATLVGRYLLGLKTEAQPEPTPSSPAEEKTEAVLEKAAPAAEAPAAHAPEAASAPAHAPAHAPAQEQGSGSSAILLILALVGIVGAVIILDKTVLRP
jgi:hypothetical protein